MGTDKTVIDAEEAVADIPDGATLLVGGFGDAGAPKELLNALARRRLSGLTIVSNNAGSGSEGIAALLAAGSVRKVVCSYPKSAGSFAFEQCYESGSLELELVPQGTLSERIRAAGAGIGGFYTRTGVGTLLTEGREVRELGGEQFVFETPLSGDFALFRAHRGDRWGNLVYDKSARNFGPTMAMAAATSIAEVDQIVPLGSLDPEVIVTPGIFVDRIVEITA
ncbi:MULTISPECIES: 3-oxoacid CoA-transferase subunit A [Microbacterium]|uniref:3-oxoadipate CoA-transferase, alpha subunit n=1 Tax=Microbacterium saccharophilum TaxID=1213358 RepID=A0A7Z7D0P0_9MICO|nr:MULTISPECIES: 3-oxoacid CoA-transferase subunit A [Microbacterium]SFI60815.1 3-oxoadipate CoA-transferase, alpha subunit [Microbacterium saccharophilum]